MDWCTLNLYGLVYSQPLCVVRAYLVQLKPHGVRARSVWERQLYVVRSYGMTSRTMEGYTPPPLPPARLSATHGAQAGKRRLVSGLTLPQSLVIPFVPFRCDHVMPMIVAIVTVMVTVDLL